MPSAFPSWMRRERNARLLKRCLWLIFTKMGPGASRSLVYSMALDTTRPAEEVVLYAATSEGVFKTADGGKNWSDLSGPLPGRNVGGILWNAAHPKRLYVWFHRESYAEKAGGVFRTDDAGGSWRRVGAQQLGHVYSMAQCQSQPEVLLAVAAATGANPTNVAKALELRQQQPYWQSWRSDDGGETWRLLDPRAASLVAVHPLNPDIVYLGLGGMGDLIEKEVMGLFVSRDGGKTWLDANRGAAFTLNGEGAVFPNRSYNNCLVFDPQDPQHVFVGCHSCVYEGRCPLRRGRFPPGRGAKTMCARIASKSSGWLMVGLVAELLHGAALAAAPAEPGSLLVNGDFQRGLEAQDIDRHRSEIEVLSWLERFHVPCSVASGVCYCGFRESYATC